MGRLKETLLQAFDHWHLCKLLQTLIRGGIEPMDEGEALAAVARFRAISASLNVVPSSFSTGTGSGGSAASA